MKLIPKIKAPAAINRVPEKIRQQIRGKAIDRARTRIAIAGSDPAQMSQRDLEILVREEEDRIKGSIKEKGLLAVLAILGLNFFA
ncbi:MAG: hypothetical protein AAF197_02125 [Pseudomonadota bacterium]